MVPSNLDEAIYLFFACPYCEKTQYLSLDMINFCADIDLSVTVDGTTDAWLECECQHCGGKLDRSLTRDPSLKSNRT
jgi:hypothetical protein